MAFNIFLGIDSQISLSDPNAVFLGKDSHIKLETLQDMEASQLEDDYKDKIDDDDEVSEYESETSFVSLSGEL